MIIRGTNPADVAFPEIVKPSVAVPDTLQAQAAEEFADEVTAGRVPSIRAIRASLHVGQSRAELVRAYLATLSDGYRSPLRGVPSGHHPGSADRSVTTHVGQRLRACGDHHTGDFAVQGDTRRGFGADLDRVGLSRQQQSVRAVLLGLVSPFLDTHRRWRLRDRYQDRAPAFSLGWLQRTRARDQPRELAVTCPSFTWRRADLGTLSAKYARCR